jgi:hypothetical protein
LSRLLSGRSSVVREGRLSGGFSEYWTPLGGPKSARRRVRKRRLSRRKEEGEVVAAGGEDGVGAVPVAFLLGLQLADDRLNRGSALHLAADRSGHRRT